MSDPYFPNATPRPITVRVLRDYLDRLMADEPNADRWFVAVDEELLGGPEPGGGHYGGVGFVSADVQASDSLGEGVVFLSLSDIPEDASEFLTEVFHAEQDEHHDPVPDPASPEHCAVCRSVITPEGGRHG